MEPLGAGARVIPAALVGDNLGDPFRHGFD